MNLHGSYSAPVIVNLAFRIIRRCVLVSLLKKAKWPAVQWPLLVILAGLLGDSWSAWKSYRGRGNEILKGTLSQVWEMANFRNHAGKNDNSLFFSRWLCLWIPVWMMTRICIRWLHFLFSESVEIALIATVQWLNCRWLPDSGRDNLGAQLYSVLREIQHVFTAYMSQKGARS